MDPLVSSSYLGEDPQQVQRDTLGTAFGAEQDLGNSLLSWLLLAQQGKAFLSARLFVGCGAEGAKDGKASGKKGLMVHEEQTSHLTENYY